MHGRRNLKHTSIIGIVEESHKICYTYLYCFKITIKIIELVKKLDIIFIGSWQNYRRGVWKISWPNQTRETHSAMPSICKITTKNHLKLRWEIALVATKRLYFAIHKNLD